MYVAEPTPMGGGTKMLQKQLAYATANGWLHTPTKGELPAIRPGDVYNSNHTNADGSDGTHEGVVVRVTPRDDGSLEVETADGGQGTRSAQKATRQVRYFSIGDATHPVHVVSPSTGGNGWLDRWIAIGGDGADPGADGGGAPGSTPGSVPGDAPDTNGGGDGGSSGSGGSGFGVALGLAGAALLAGAAWMGLASAPHAAGGMHALSSRRGALRHASCSRAATSPTPAFASPEVAARAADAVRELRALANYPDSPHAKPPVTLRAAEALEALATAFREAGDPLDYAFIGEAEHHARSLRRGEPWLPLDDYADQWTDPRGRKAREWAQYKMLLGAVGAARQAAR
jgi:hypothetical protein